MLRKVQNNLQHIWFTYMLSLTENVLIACAKMVLLRLKHTVSIEHYELSRAKPENSEIIVTLRA